MIHKHKKKIYALAGVIIVAASFYAYIMTPRGVPLVFLESDELFQIVQDGDIICRLGDRFWSQLFRDVSVEDRRYSHVGIVRVDSASGEVTVIHAEGNTGHGRDDVNEVTLPEFLKVARAAGVYRINNADADIDVSRISALAMEYLGIPFDWRFDMRDTTALYCTELLYVVLKRAAPALKLKTAYVKEIGKEVIPLEAISNSEHFTEVYFISAL